jgi:hypothetical protein
MIKFLTMLGAAGLMAAATAPVPAAAQQRTTTVTRTVVKHSGPRWGTRKVCNTRWRNGRKIRTCRTVRYRRY